MSAPPKLSLALIVKNEARCLDRCLRSVREAVQEIVVVDTGSTDDTVRIARGFGAKVATFAWINDFAAARNHALDQCSGEWVLMLDADEHASPALAAELGGFIKGPPAVGRLKIISDFRRNNQLLRSQTFVSRLFPRGARFEGRIHEQLVSTLPRRNLQGELWHDGYLENRKSERNIQLLLQELERVPGDTYYLFQLALEYASLNQTKNAWDCCQQALAGARGDEPFLPNLAVDCLYAGMELKQFESGLQLIDRMAGALQDFPDFYLVCGLFYMNLVRGNPAKFISFLPRIEAAFRSALAIGETGKYKSVRGAGSFLAQFNLGTFYHVFGDAPAARRCFEAAADLGYEPARRMLRTV